MSAPITSSSAMERVISSILIMLNSLGDSNQWQMVSLRESRRISGNLCFASLMKQLYPEMVGNPGKANTYLSALVEAIKVRKSLTFRDLGWCEEVNLILLMGSSLIFPLVIRYSFFWYVLCWTWSCHSRLPNTIIPAFLTSHREHLHS